MTIYLKKFGEMLISRPSGKEAWLAFQPVLNQIKPDELVVVDFAGVKVLAPSWADEFLTPLKIRFSQQVQLENTSNASVKATLAILESNSG